MIDRKHDLPVSRQASVLGISRGSVYYLPRAVGDADLALMRRIDEMHVDYPFAGSRMLQGLLKQEGLSVGRLHVATLMRKMDIEALYRRLNTSKPEPGHKVFPYLLRKLPVTRPNQRRESVDLLNLVYHGDIDRREDVEDTTTIDEKFYSLLSERMRDRYDICGTLPDVIDDDWIDDIKRLDAKLAEFTERRKRANAFDLRYGDSVTADDERVHARTDVVERLSRGWGERAETEA
jgi:putative transposase